MRRFLICCRILTIVSIGMAKLVEVENGSLLTDQIDGK